MSYTELKVGASIPGEFRRLKLHGSVLNAYRQSGLPQFSKAAAGSTGAIVITSVAGWNDHSFDRFNEISSGLKAGDIFSIPWEKKAAGVLASGALLLPLINLLESREKSTRSKMVLHGAESVVGLGVTGYLVNSLLYSDALFSNKPLRRLLERTVNFEVFTKSKTEIVIMATDFQTGEHVAFSSKKDINSLSDLVTVLIASSSVPVYFPVCSFGGRVLTDAEVRSDFPIDQLIDMDVVLDFSYRGGKVYDADGASWGGHFHGMWDIAKDRISECTRKEYERRRETDPSLPEVVTLETTRKIPPLLMESFSKEELERTTELGKEIFRENEQKIRDAFDRALERKAYRNSLPGRWLAFKTRASVLAHRFGDYLGSAA